VLQFAVLKKKGSIMKQLLLFLFLFSTLSLAQDNIGRTNMIDTWKPVQYNSDGVNAIFLDDMNGDNTLAGVQARGWVFENVDGGYSTTIFQGNPEVFSAYEGPSNGYIAQNYAGNNGLLIDQWLISPPVTVNAGDTLKFWHRSIDGSTYPDPLQVWVSTTGGATHTAFDVQLASFMASTTGWHQYIGNFPTSGVVRFAVRYYTTNGGPNGTQSNYVGLDYFEVNGAPCTFGAVSDPSPANAATDVSINLASIGWVNGSGATQIEVWFDWSMVYSGPPITSYAIPGPLTYNHTYSWKVNETDSTCWTHGSIWTFTTEQDSNLYCWEDDFSLGTGNWTITNDGGTCVWQIHQANEYTMPPAAVGNVLAADADFCGNGSTLLSTARITTPFDFSQYSYVYIEFDSDFYPYDTADRGWVYVSNNGIDWTLVRFLNFNSWARNKHEVIDITQYAAMQSTVYVKLGSYQPGWDYWWAVDNFKVCAGGIIPVELKSFNASVNINSVNLNWSTATETNNSGFQIERSNGSAYVVVGFAAGNGTTTEIQHYTFTDNNVSTGKYSYRLKQIDLDGTFEYSKTIDVEVTTPLEFSLAQNFPNPFNPSTSIKYAISNKQFVQLKIFDVLGKEVATLVNEEKSAGSYEVNFNASQLSSGIYFYKLQSGSFVQTRKMILLK
jgi:hypothetical protein